MDRLSQRGRRPAGGTLIALCPADLPPSPAPLRAPGGFTWFYVDLVDDQGQAATLIWSWGLPFLPGYASAARAGRAELPLDRPSVNLVLYSNGQERFYLLSELPAEAATWGADGRSWQLGGCRFTWVDEAAADGGAPTRALEAQLDLPLPTGGRAQGRLWLRGPLRRDPAHATGAATTAAEDPRCTHKWTPMVAAGAGGLDLRWPGGEATLRGRAYHDRNSAEQPLHALGIQSWWWGRLALPGRELIFYQLLPAAPGARPRDLVVEITDQGATRVQEDAGLQVQQLQRSLWGLSWPRAAHFPDPDGARVEVRVEAVLDDGPFYQRYLLHGRCGDQTGRGIGENVVPDRVDTDLLRPLVSMRVHRSAGPNSMWLPLFSGDRQGRWPRLLGLRAAPRGAAG